MSAVATTAEVVDFLGLSEAARIADDGEASFPVGVLYPYSRDLQRVCSCYDTLHHNSPAAATILLTEAVGPAVAQSPAVVAFLASIATLYSRIAFAPGPAGASVGAAYRRVADGLIPEARRGRL
jgi:hypothetical protein